MRAVCAAYIVVLALQGQLSSAQNVTATRCKVPNKAPENIEKVIALCQEEIQQTLIAEALEALNVQEAVMFAQNDEKPLNENDGDEKVRRKRSYFSEDEQKIAGCLLQCVFRRKNALNALGYPTVEGMVHLYTEGIDEKPYVLATVQAVHTCLNKVHIVVDQNEKNTERSDQAIDTSNKSHSKVIGTTCEVAYQVFDCVSDKIQEYCGQSP
ncbi:general odorant-binding protein 70-like [Atheta coriaria]|uniref:general odorant-binding protein 70-like n=1 Tax=Dalotia coriaria TaxID=877792 RepID=UPI0031F3EC28